MRRALGAIIAFLAALAIIVVIERQPGTPIGNLVECVAAIGLLVVLAWATRGILRNALMMIASLLVGLTMVDGALWAMAMHTSASEPVPETEDSGLSHARPLVGWGPHAPGVFHVVKKYPDGRVVYDVHVTIDASLNRKTVPSSNRGAIAFFGDSVVFGDGLNDGETLPQTFAALNGGKIPVWNLAFSGWSPSQNLAALQEGLYKPLLNAPRHFFLFTSSFHVERTACKNEWSVSPAPRYVLADGKVVNRGPCSTQLYETLSRFAQRFALYDRIAPIFLSVTRKDVETYLKIVETFVAEAKRDYNVPTTILYLKLDEDYLRGTGYDQAMLIDAMRKAGADVFVEPPPPSGQEALYEIEGDHHPTGLANRMTARQIEQHLKTVDPAALQVDGAQTARP